MGSHTAGPWKSETFNTKLQQNSKSAPKRSVIMRSVKGLEAILGEGMTHTASVQVAQKALPAVLWGAQYTSEPPARLSCCSLVSTGGQGLGRAQELTDPQAALPSNYCTCL